MLKPVIRRIDGANYVRLDVGLAVVPVALLDQVREEWSARLADAVLKGEAVVNLFGVENG